MAEMINIRLSLSMCSVEDFLHDGGVEVRPETVLHWWNNCGPVFATEFWDKCVGASRCHRHWHVGFLGFLIPRFDGVILSQE